MAITLFIVMFAFLLAICGGFAVGRRRGMKIGFAVGIGVLMIECLGYVALVAATWNM